MNDDFTQNGGVTESQGDYSAPQPQADYGTTQSQDAGAQTGNYGQNDAQTGAYQQQTGSYGQNSFAGTNSYSYSNGSAYTNQSQNLYYGQAMQDKGDSIGFGVASMVLGILSMLTFCCCVNYIFAVLAIIFGIVQMVKSNKKGMAVTGIITAAISIIISIIFWIAAYSGGAEYNLKEYQEKILEQEFTGV